MHHAKKEVRPRNRRLGAGFEPLEGRWLLSGLVHGLAVPDHSTDFAAAPLVAAEPIRAATADYSVAPLQGLTIATNTGEKPQSKVWFHDNRWWSVLGDSDGTAVFRLDGKAWTRVLRLSSGRYQADVRAVGNVAHVLLENGTSSKLASIEYLPGSPGTYKQWSARSTLTTLTLGSGIETATLDLDSTGRLWVASDANRDVEVRYSDYPYKSFSAPITVASGITSDDIAVVTALPGKIGVLWSNQATRQFGFRYHSDGAAPGTWSDREVPASRSARNSGNGMADDHLNVAVASDGTLYAAVKTGYQSEGLPAIGLLVRRPNGQWDPLYPVDVRKSGHSGSRGIVLLNEATQRVLVAYRNTDSAGPIVYRESPLKSISFGAEKTLIAGSTVNNVSSTKQNWTSEFVAIAATDNHVVQGVLVRSTASGSPSRGNAAIATRTVVAIADTAALPPWDLRSIAFGSRAETNTNPLDETERNGVERSAAGARTTAPDAAGVASVQSRIDDPAMASSARTVFDEGPHSLPSALTATARTSICTEFRHLTQLLGSRSFRDKR